ncbi:protein NRT1/ PTR FAMILY 4.6-like [Miscanthus floridulus]|uniref:protein NRT1/ PTR FAMILY 4.6-like n=1 Tax=Miscanthus floridulus TaxID=154761 RepID=UPI00345B1BC1
MEGEEVYVDWRGNAVDERRHGGIRATLFLYVLFMLRSCSNSSNFSMVGYLHGMLHLDIVTSSIVISYLGGTVMISAALMNFISDACIKRTTTIFVFGPCVVLGYMLLALQAHFLSLHPEICAIDKEPNNCEAAQGWNLTLLYLSLLMFAIGEGYMRACIPSLGGDQFSNSDPKKSQLQSVFLTRLKFANSLGAIIGLAFLVWIKNNLGWNIGFMMCTLIVLVGLLVAASGYPFYCTQKPIGSPLTRTLQVLIISSNKKSTANVDVIELQESNTQDHIFKSGTSQADETRVLVQMLPIFISCFLIYLPFTLLMTLSIQVGRAMDKGAGVIQIPSASLIAIPTAFHMLMQPCYSRILTLLLRTTTGHEHGVTPLQRIGAGSACGIAAACVATLVEARRLNVAEQHGLTSIGAGVPMSVFWLVIQFFLLSIMDIASFGGLIEFIESEAPSTMKLIAPAVQSCIAGFSAWSCSAFIQLVNRMTRSGDGGGGWLDGTNFNKTRLDHFFLLLGAFEVLALINYTFWARRYARKLRISTVETHEDDTRN